MPLEPISKAMAYSVKNLSSEELIEFNRRLRLFRVCMGSVLTAVTGLYFALFTEQAFTPKQEFNISGLNLSDWHLFQVLYILTLLVPTIILFFLTSTLI
ncbi:MAG: hypothetical protein WA902_06320, partial [Thermosynechococcaceae cyanobacterium]